MALGPEPLLTPTATAAPGGEAESQGALLCEYLDPKRNGALFSRRKAPEPFPFTALQEWLEMDRSSGARGLRGTQLFVSAGRELGWGHPLCPNFHSRIAASSSPRAAALAARSWWGLTRSQPLPQSLPCFRGSRAANAGTVSPLLSSISAHSGVLASWDRWQRQGHEVPMPSVAAQCCAQLFQGPGGAHSPIQVPPTKVVHWRSPKGSRQTKEPQTTSQPPGMPVGWHRLQNCCWTGETRLHRSFFRLKSHKKILSSTTRCLPA